MLIASEAGELLAEYRSVPNTASDAHSAAPDSRARITAEIGDVGIALAVRSALIRTSLFSRPTTPNG